MNLAEINAILRQFSLTATSFTDLSESGFSGANIFLVTGSQFDVILKGYQASIDSARLEFIHEVMCCAVQNGFTKTPRLSQTVDGNTKIFAGGRYWEVTSVVSGHELVGIPNVVQCKILGEAVARLHVSMKSFSKQKSLRVAGFVTYESLMAHHNNFRNLVREHRKLFEEYETYSLVSTFIDDTEKVLEQSFKASHFNELQRRLPRTMLHRDLWNANIFFDGDVFCGIIDFVNVKHGARIDDLAKLVIEVTQLSETETTALLRAYDSVWSFTQEEKDILLQWILQWVIFSPAWHVEQYVIQAKTKFGSRNQHGKAIEDANRSLQALKEGSLTYLENGHFLAT